MGYRDLGAFIRALEEKGELRRISVPVDSELEIAHIADRVSKQDGPALLFENVVGSPYPVLMNAFGSMKRMAMALGVESIDEIGQDILDFMDLSKYAGLTDKIKSIPRLARLAFVFPVKVPTGECQQVVEEPDLTKLPVLKCWPQDGGRFFTLPLIITRDPDTGTHNMGMYRLQVFDEKTTGMHWHLHKDGRSIYEKYRQRGEKMPVSVVVGADPATMYAATAPLPKMIGEYLFAGFLRRAPLEIVRCKTNDLYVPAHAEFILEGYVDPAEPLRTEGPFGDHTGYYSLSDEYPVFHVEKITRRREPVYPATVVGPPPMEDCFLAKATERIFKPLLQMIIPELVDYSFPLEGVFHNCVIISIDKRYPGQANKVMHAAWGMGQLMYTKMVIVVDKDVDPHDMSKVMWKVFNNIDAARDLTIVKGPLDALDHASPLAHLGHKLGIDATRKWPEEGHTRPWPEDLIMSAEIAERVEQRWKEYGL